MKTAGRIEGGRGFTILELLVVIAIVAILAAVLLATLPQALAAANRADSTARLRAIGQAVLSSSADHNGQLPGPFWPGQVMVYDTVFHGRVVSELADYLGVERREQPYLVENMIPRAYRSAMRGRDLDEGRVYVMNRVIEIDGETLHPFGTLGAGDVPLTSPLPLARFARVPENERWMAAEADQLHPDVAAAPWRANTPARPIHDHLRGVVRFDGSVTFEKP